VLLYFSNTQEAEHESILTLKNLCIISVALFFESGIAARIGKTKKTERRTAPGTLKW